MEFYFEILKIISNFEKLKTSGFQAWLLLLCINLKTNEL